jgi:hypothetical protein
VEIYRLADACLRLRRVRAASALSRRSSSSSRAVINRAWKLQSSVAALIRARFSRPFGNRTEVRASGSSVTCCPRDGTVPPSPYAAPHPHRQRQFKRNTHDEPAAAAAASRLRRHIALLTTSALTAPTPGGIVVAPIPRSRRLGLLWMIRPSVLGWGRGAAGTTRRQCRATARPWDGMSGGGHDGRSGLRCAPDGAC